MPYKVSKRKSKWVVTKKSGGRAFGKHDTKKAAKRQMRALYAAEGRRKRKK